MYEFHKQRHCALENLNKHSLELIKETRVQHNIRHHLQLFQKSSSRKLP